MLLQWFWNIIAFIHRDHIHNEIINITPIMLSRLSQTCLNSYLWKPVQFIPRIIGRVITRYPKTTFLTGSSIFLYMNYEYNAFDSIVLKDIKIPQ